MKIRARQKSFFLHLLVIFVLIFVAGCQRIGIGAGAQPQPAPPPQEIKAGPPAHAPAHGYRAKYKYRYYPDSEVYYDTGRNLYFYMANGQWTAAVSLPGSIRLGTSYASLELNTSRPYEYHDQHASKHRGKKKK